MVRILLLVMVLLGLAACGGDGGDGADPGDEYWEEQAAAAAAERGAGDITVSGPNCVAGEGGSNDCPQTVVIGDGNRIGSPDTTSTTTTTSGAP